ncbi:AAA family ATPase [Methylobacterium sp. J-048]|uniref:AAA family ATPase n=1 Tax=Methylobacterium sp. J-048 TaxID=2836635 RepID=UPI001FB9F0CA|nr:AAA family ATPase [Methylobacterium sp. J-048]MCJ2061047.1 AAA family ATPase [Methylobacterium sp. J-048]
MKLVKYQVTNFRSVEDSGWIDVSDVTALIGENEAGKTNLLLPLWKLNPSGNGKISHLDDMPRARYAEMRTDPGRYDFIRCIFRLNDSERDICERWGADRTHTETIVVFRDFAGRYGISFENYNFAVPKAFEKVRIAKISEAGEANDADRGPSLHQMLRRHLPKFVYYSNYGNLDAQIYLPHVVDNLGRDDLGAKEAAKTRTLKVLFDLVSLSPKEILELAKATVVTERINQYGHRTTDDEKSDEQIVLDDEQLRTRAALLQSASAKLTRTFRDWWKQGDYRFRLQADGNYFRIWVADERRSEEIELENRSTGLQWFLSFFLVFTYESEDTHENAIVLLDEPGHSLHPMAQRDLTRFFDSLAKTHQIAFTTHSPFMIDADRLDRVRKVFVDERGGTKSSANLSEGTRGSGATYAVHSALNLSVAESLLLGCTPVIVEGPSDQHYLSAIKTILIRKGKIKPRGELVFPPSGGAKTAKLIAAILMGRDDTLPYVLLDGDTAGSQAAKNLKDTLYQHFQKIVFTTDQFITGMTETEIEDLMPPELVIQVVDKMERRPKDEFEDVYKTGLPIVPQIKAWATANGITLAEGWKVTLSLGVKNRLLANPDRYAGEAILKTWADMFRKFA